MKKINGKKLELTFKQDIFLQAYYGDVKPAAKKAGLSTTYCYQLLKKPHFVEALKKRNEHVLGKKGRVIATREQRQGFWTTVMFDDAEDMVFRLKASELLGRSEADFIERHKHDIGGSLMQIVAELHNKAKNNKAKMGALSAGAEAAQITDDGSQGSKQGQNAITQVQTSSEVIEHDNAGNTDG